MYVLFETQPVFKTISDRLKNLSLELVRELNPESNTRLIPANTNIVTDPALRDLFFLIKEGSLSHKINDKILYILEEGDLAGLEGPDRDILNVISSDFAVVVQAYKCSDLLELCKNNPQKNALMLEYCRQKLQLITQLVHDLLKSEVTLMPALSHYKKGDVIIKQNETAGEVYTLVEGSAEAFVDGVKVGDIKRDEIFGMIAAITSTPRTATVIAAENCLALAVPNNKFLDLINNKPQTVLKLLEDMSKLIIELNKKVVGLNNFKY